MAILTLHDNYCARASYLPEGAIVSVVSKEHSTTKKNQRRRYPWNTVERIAQQNRLTLDTPHYIAIPRLIGPSRAPRILADLGPWARRFTSLPRLLLRSKIGDAGPTLDSSMPATHYAGTR